MFYSLWCHLCDGYLSTLCYHKLEMFVYSNAAGFRINLNEIIILNEWFVIEYRNKKDTFCSSYGNIVSRVVQIVR